MMVLTLDLAAALDRYWLATSRADQRRAYLDARRAGLLPCHGEAPDPAIDDPWKFGGYEDQP